MVYNDGTQFGFSEPQGAGIVILLNAIYGIPTTGYTPDVAPNVVTFTPDTPPVNP